MLRITAPQGVSLDYTTQQMRRIEELIQPLRDSGEIANTFANVGAGGSVNSGFMVMTLAPWDQRERSQQQIVADINELMQQVPGVRAFAITPNSLGIRGAGNGLQFAIVGNSYAELDAAAAKIIAEMEKDPRFQQPRLSTDATQPQLSVAIDRERASDLGIDITGLAESMQAMLDGREIGDVFIEDRSYPVKLISTSNPINDPTDLENIFLKASDGRYVPMSTIATLTEQRRRALAVARAAAARRVDHLEPRAGFALGEALTARRGDRRAAPAARRAHHSAGRSRDARRNHRQHADHLRLRHRHHPAGAGGAVRELRQRRHHHGDRAARARLRGLRADLHRHVAQRLQPDRPRAAGRRHGQERHPDRRVRQPAARPRAAACARRSSRPRRSACAR